MWAHVKMLHERCHYTPAGRSKPNDDGRYCLAVLALSNPILCFVRLQDPLHLYGTEIEPNGAH